MPKAKKARSCKKCYWCRRDKKKCLPKNRSWQESRCDHCERYDYTCTPNLTTKEEAALNIGPQKHAPPRRLVMRRSQSSYNLAAGSVSNEDENMEKERSTIMPENSDLTVLDDCASRPASSSIDWSKPYSNPEEVKRLISDWQNVQARLLILRNKLRDLLDRCRLAGSLDEAAIIDHCLDQLVCSLNLVNDMLRDPVVPASFRMAPIETAMNSRDYYDMAEDSASVSTLPGGSSLWTNSISSDQINPSSENLEDRYQDFVSRVQIYCPSLELLAKLSAFVHLAEGMQYLRDDQDLIIPNDWFSNLGLQTDRRYPSDIFRILTIYIAVDLDLPKLLAFIPQDNPTSSQTLLHLASRLGKCKTALYLIDSGADVNAADGSGMPPLHAAFEQGQMELVAHLIWKGADVNISNIRGETLLHLSLDQNHQNEQDPPCDTMAHYLLEVGAKPEHENYQGRNALHVAALSGSPDLVQMLALKLCQTAALEAQDVFGFTPLHCAIQNGNIQAAIILIEHGHRVNICDKRKRTPLHLACSELCTSEARTLFACLMDAHAIIDSVDDTNSAPLHLAAEVGNVEAVRNLLERKADPGVVNNIACRPYDLALIYQHHEVCTMLDNHLASGIRC